MKKLIHYSICLCSIIRKYFIDTLTFIKFNTSKLFRVISVLLHNYIEDSGTDERGLDLNDIYPDRGKLGTVAGFEFKKSEFDLSIITPVYNLSGYIEQCLGSIVSQKTQYSYEILIVDDGSTDDTIQRAAKFKASNVSIIRQDNSGQSAARNRAISMSRGRYLMFVDGDDLLLPGAIEHLMREALNNQSDIAEGSFVWFYDKITDEMISCSSLNHRISSYSDNPYFVLPCYGYSWGKVYKRELWQTLRFPEGYIFEDVITKFILRRKANRVVFTGVPVYGYRVNANSSSHGNNTFKKLDSVWVFPKIVALCNQEGAPMDDVFYLLSLNHIGLLNYIMTRNHTYDVKRACFKKMRSQLNSIQQSRPKKIPIMFKMLEKSILCGDFEAWENVAGTIIKYDMLKKWRERN